MQTFPPEWLSLPSVTNLLSSHELEETRNVLARYPNIDIKYKVSINESSFDDEESVDVDEYENRTFEAGSEDTVFIQVILSRKCIEQGDVVVSSGKASIVPFCGASVPDNLLGQREESGWAVLGYEKTLLAIKRFPIGGWTVVEDGSLRMKLVLEGVLPNVDSSSSNNIMELRLFVISDTWIGSDQEFRIKIRLVSTE